MYSFYGNYKRAPSDSLYQNGNLTSIKGIEIIHVAWSPNLMYFA